MSTSLQSSFTGKLTLPTDSDWDVARVGAIFNGRRPTRQPNAVLQAATVDDVIAGVRLARERGWSVAVRSGGHAWAGWSVRDGSLLIDLGLLQEMDYDPATEIASAQPAVHGGDTLSPYLEGLGRFFNGGHCPSVGIGGFLLQGGQGWCQRGWGWAAESVVGIDVVTAEGELVHATADQHEDLYWAARGAGPSFPGVVTRFYLKTRPKFGYVGHTVHMYELEEFTEVMTWLYGIHADFSPDVEIVVVSLTPPAVGDEPRKRRFIVTGVALVADRAAAEAALAPFNTSPALDRAVMVQDCVQSSLAEQRDQQNLQNPRGARYITDNIWATGDAAESLERLRPLFTDLPTPEAFTIWFSNAPMRPLPEMAFSLQSEVYVATYMVYEDPAEDAPNRSWLNQALEYAHPVTVGQYLGDSDMTNRQLKFMADENYARLQSIIADRDPEGLFVRYLAHDPTTVNRNHWEL